MLVPVTLGDIERWDVRAHIFFLVDLYNYVNYVPMIRFTGVLISEG